MAWGRFLACPPLPSVHTLTHTQSPVSLVIGCCFGVGAGRARAKKGSRGRFFESFCAQHTSSAFCQPLRRCCRRRLRRFLLYCFIVSLGIWQFACWFFMTIMYVNFGVPRSLAQSPSLSLSSPLSLLSLTNWHSIPNFKLNSSSRPPAWICSLSCECVLVCGSSCMCVYLCLSAISSHLAYEIFKYFWAFSFVPGRTQTSSQPNKKNPSKTAIFSFYLSLSRLLSLVCVFCDILLSSFFMLCIKVWVY